MKLGIMQPYLFPYIGYFQLINTVDCFVIYDDVNFIKRGWINRNRILLNGRDHLFTLSLIGASQFRLINQVQTGDNKDKVLKTIEQAYARAPQYREVMPLVASVLQNEETNLSKYIENSIRKTAEFIGIETRIIVSSGIEKDNSLRGQEKILQICRILNADTYVNPIGGTDLYSRELFLSNSIKLYFIKSNLIRYRQMNDEFIPWLSILDVLMFNRKESIREMITDIELI